MPEIGPEHLLTYRQEIAAPLFAAIRAGDSSAIAGSASMGKSRLLQFMLRPDVQQHYLGEQTANTLLILVDSNRLAAVSEWGFYELLLTVLTEASGRHAKSQPLRAELNVLRREAITSRDAILARRHSELAFHMLCQEQQLSLCLILDEFDEAYRVLPALALANLRALRDANKYQLCYTLMLRDHPARLRSPADCEGFYELFSRCVLGLRPYAAEDVMSILAQLEARKGQTLQPADCDQLRALSGGHPGLLVALFDCMRSQGVSVADDMFDQPTIREECRKLWEGLANDERLALSHLADGRSIPDAPRAILELKGLIHTQHDRLTMFSPIFTRYVQTEAAPIDLPLWVDETARVVWQGGQAIRDLTAREFDMLAFLYRRTGQVCTRDEILAYLYPDESKRFENDLSDGRVDTLVKRIREKVEPIRERPRYIMTIRGKGYKLITAPEGTEPSRE
ncbi:MAG: winged helix-turn-helix domain-containing protein [Chloroflexales bacterium]|nr:winged helix-turn-helix domain-containing protein [Chloroflexales bacterium]